MWDSICQKPQSVEFGGSRLASWTWSCPRAPSGSPPVPPVVSPILKWVLPSSARSCIHISWQSQACPETQQSRLYQALIALIGWLTISAEYDVVNTSTFDEERKSQSRSMHELLTSFKFNDEPSDNITRSVMKSLSEVSQNRRSRRMLASIFATINGREFLQKMLHNVRGLSRMALYDRAKSIIRSSGHNAKLFTSSFNKQIYNRR